jgi:hypothetical protein
MPLPEALTHSPLVILTGAGASTPLGLDTTEIFRKRFYETQLRERVVDADPEFYAFMTNRLGVTDVEDIEVVLARLEANADWTDKLASDHQFVAKVLSGRPEMLNVFGSWNSKLANLIYDEVIDHYGNIDAARATALYKGLGLLEHQIVQNMTPLRTLPFFTLNYDTAVEEACRSLGVRLVDGFVEGPFTERRWDAKAYTDFVEAPDVVNCVLVKLHGSVRLGRRDDGVLVELPAGLHRDPPPYRHAVLYPSLSPKALDEEPFLTNYRLLRACLLHARLIVVIGCSMRDQALNNLVRECMDENEELRLVAIAPDADVETLARHIGCDISKLGASRGRWEIEDIATLSAGKGLVLNAIRRWMMSAVSRSDSPHKFGTNADL